MQEWREASTCSLLLLRCVTATLRSGVALPCVRERRYACYRQFIQHRSVAWFAVAARPACQPAHARVTAVPPWRCSLMMARAKIDEDAVMVTRESEQKRQRRAERLQRRAQECATRLMRRGRWRSRHTSHTSVQFGIPTSLKRLRDSLP